MSTNNKAITVAFLIAGSSLLFGCSTKVNNAPNGQGFDDQGNNHIVETPIPPTEASAKHAVQQGQGKTGMQNPSTKNAQQAPQGQAGGRWIELEEIKVIDIGFPLRPIAKGADELFGAVGKNKTVQYTLSLDWVDDTVNTVTGKNNGKKGQSTPSGENDYGYMRAPQTQQEARLQQLFATPQDSAQFSKPRIDMGATDPRAGLLTYEMTDRATGLLYRISSQRVNGEYQMVIQEKHPSAPFVRETRGRGVLMNQDPRSFNPLRDVRQVGNFTEETFMVNRSTPPTQADIACGQSLNRAGGEQNAFFKSLVGYTAFNQGVMMDMSMRQYEDDRRIDSIQEESEKEAPSIKGQYRQPKFGVLGIGK